jgi:cyanophycinase-like exopeptidase
VVDQHPELLGIGLEDEAGLLVVGDTAEVVGSGRAAIYDNARHGQLWYYWLHPGERFDLHARRVLESAARQALSVLPHPGQRPVGVSSKRLDYRP